MLALAHWIALVLLVTACSAMPALAQVAVSTSSASTVASTSTIDSEIETVEVIGRREFLRKEVRSFVTDLTASDGEFVVRWNKPICLWLAGLPADRVAFMRSRLRDLATAAGVPFNDTDACEPNLYVFVTAEPDELLSGLRKRNSRLFSASPPVEARLQLNSDRPVRAWHGSKLLNADGTPPKEHPNKSPEFRLENSHIAGSVAEHMSVVVIVVDARKTSAISLGQLTDYVAMVGYANVEPGSNVAGRPTILRLFEATASAQHIPAGLTDWDRAFLRGLYATEQSNNDYRGLIEASMTRDLARQATK